MTQKLKQMVTLLDSSAPIAAEKVNNLYLGNPQSYLQTGVYLTPGSTAFPGAQVHYTIVLMQWQYWWWFWFSGMLAFYYMFFSRIVTNRLPFLFPKATTSYRSHGRWGDLIICAIPVFWCLNILSSSHFLLRALEWQTETSPFLLRVRGKQWYWVYKLDLTNANSIDEIPVFIGRGKKVTFRRSTAHGLNTGLHRIGAPMWKRTRQDSALLKSNTLNFRFKYPNRNGGTLAGLDGWPKYTNLAPKNKMSFVKSNLGPDRLWIREDLGRIPQFVRKAADFKAQKYAPLKKAKWVQFKDVAVNTVCTCTKTPAEIRHDAAVRANVRWSSYTTARLFVGIVYNASNNYTLQGRIMSNPRLASSILHPDLIKAHRNFKKYITYKLIQQIIWLNKQIWLNPGHVCAARVLNIIVDRYNYGTSWSQTGFHYSDKNSRSPNALTDYNTKRLEMLGKGLRVLTLQKYRRLSTEGECRVARYYNGMLLQFFSLFLRETNAWLGLTPTGRRAKSAHRIVFTRIYRAHFKPLTNYARGVSRDLLASSTDPRFRDIEDRWQNPPVQDWIRSWVNNRAGFNKIPKHKTLLKNSPWMRSWGDKDPQKVLFGGMAGRHRGRSSIYGPIWFYQDYHRAHKAQTRILDVVFFNQPARDRDFRVLRSVLFAGHFNKSWSKLKGSICDFPRWYACLTCTPTYRLRYIAKNPQNKFIRTTQAEFILRNRSLRFHALKDRLRELRGFPNPPSTELTRLIQKRWTTLYILDKVGILQRLNAIHWCHRVRVLQTTARYIIESKKTYNVRSVWLHALGLYKHANHPYQHHQNFAFYSTVKLLSSIRLGRLMMKGVTKARRDAAPISAVLEAASRLTSNNKLGLAIGERPSRPKLLPEKLIIWRSGERLARLESVLPRVKYAAQQVDRMGRVHTFGRMELVQLHMKYNASRVYSNKKKKYVSYPTLTAGRDAAALNNIQILWKIAKWRSTNKLASLFSSGYLQRSGALWVRRGSTEDFLTAHLKRQLPRPPRHVEIVVWWRGNPVRMGVLSRNISMSEWIKKIRAVQNPSGPVLTGRRILRRITTRIYSNRPRGFDLVHAISMRTSQNSYHLLRYTPILVWFAVTNSKTNLQVEHVFNVLSTQARLWKASNPTLDFLNAYTGIPDFNRSKAPLTKMAMRYIYKKVFGVLYIDYKTIMRCKAVFGDYRPSKFGTAYLYRIWAVSKFRSLCTIEAPSKVYAHLRDVSIRTLKFWQSRTVLIDCYTKYISALELHTKLFGADATRRAINYEYVFRGLWKRSLSIKPWTYPKVMPLTHDWIREVRFRQPLSLVRTYEAFRDMFVRADIATMQPKRYMTIKNPVKLLRLFLLSIKIRSSVATLVKTHTKKIVTTLGLNPSFELPQWNHRGEPHQTAMYFLKLKNKKKVLWFKKLLTDIATLNGLVGVARALKNSDMPKLRRIGALKSYYPVHIIALNQAGVFAAINKRSGRQWHGYRPFSAKEMGEYRWWKELGAKSFLAVFKNLQRKAADFLMVFGNEFRYVVGIKANLHARAVTQLSNWSSLQKRRSALFAFCTLRSMPRVTTAEFATPLTGRINPPSHLPKPTLYLTNTAPTFCHLPERFIRETNSHRWVKNNPFGKESLVLRRGGLGQFDILSLEFCTHGSRSIRRTEPNISVTIKQKKIEKTTFSSKLDNHSIGSDNKIWVIKSGQVQQRDSYVEAYRYDFRNKNVVYGQSDKLDYFDRSYPQNKRLLWVNKQIVLPTKVSITIITNSYDVIHSWFIPGLGLKLDCVPGRSTHHTIYIEKQGYYYGQCAEVCGRRHHHMPIKILAVPYKYFVYWWKESVQV